MTDFTLLYFTLRARHVRGAHARCEEADPAPSARTARATPGNAPFEASFALALSLSLSRALTRYFFFFFTAPMPPPFEKNQILDFLGKCNCGDQPLAASFYK